MEVAHMCCSSQRSRQAGRTVRRQPWRPRATSCRTLSTLPLSERRTKSDREESRATLAFGLRNVSVVYFHFSSTTGIIYDTLLKGGHSDHKESTILGRLLTLSMNKSSVLRLESLQLMHQSQSCPPQSLEHMESNYPLPDHQSSLSKLNNLRPFFTFQLKNS